MTARGNTRKHEATATLSPEAFRMLHELMDRYGRRERLAVMLGTTISTIQAVRDPHGRVKPATVARLEGAIAKLARYGVGDLDRQAKAAV